MRTRSFTVSTTGFAVVGGVLVVVPEGGGAGRGIGGSGFPPGWNPAALAEQALADEDERRRREREERELAEMMLAGLL